MCARTVARRKLLAVVSIVDPGADDIWVLFGLAGFVGLDWFGSFFFFLGWVWFECGLVWVRLVRLMAGVDLI